MRKYAAMILSVAMACGGVLGADAAVKDEVESAADEIVQAVETIRQETVDAAAVAEDAEPGDVAQAESIARSPGEESDEAAEGQIDEEELPDAYELYNSEGSFGLGIFEGGDVDVIDNAISRMRELSLEKEAMEAGREADKKEYDNERELREKVIEAKDAEILSEREKREELEKEFSERQEKEKAAMEEKHARETEEYANKSEEEKAELKKQQEEETAKLEEAMSALRQDKEEAQKKIAEVEEKLLQEREEQEQKHKEELEKLEQDFTDRQKVLDEEFEKRQREVFNSPEGRALLKKFQENMAKNDYAKVGKDGLPLPYWCFSTDCCSVHNVVGWHYIQAKWSVTVCPPENNAVVKAAKACTVIRRR